MLVTVNIKLPSGVEDARLPSVIRLSVSAAAIICDGPVTSLISAAPPVEKTMSSPVPVVENVVVPSGTGVHPFPVQVPNGAVMVRGIVPVSSNAVIPD